MKYSLAISALLYSV
jgi:hypothetical protein